ncbi:HAD family hydrolase [Aliarcobacter cryaerophilus]|uniref:HAD family hydrolase n=1 Tax=Aliarcobacter cryaerophilus TaxID=28198 RepID=UPI0021B5CEDC|nr:HAD family hydrolase [Aliarcobacter cryaerophilus]MCT7509995.1 HAD family hydrolase [Aliarcobacter cryaerophilus]
MNNIKLVITDLDNTLYDWFTPWYKAYKLFIDDVLDNTDIQEKDLLDAIKKIHQKHGTAEYAFDFLLKELTIFQDKYPKDKIDNLRHKFYKTKKDYLKLYPSVMETLCLLRSQGCTIVAYTESMAFYANDRLRKLGLDGIIDKLYSPEEHDVPEDFQTYYSKDYYQLKKTDHIYLPLNHKKPDTDILNNIINQFDFKKDEILYIGDSLTKDIKMAKDIGIIDVHAEYGLSHHKEEYELLKKVTHWTDEEVEKEKNTTKEHIEPTYVLKASFSELLNEFKFNENTEKELENLIKIWDRTIDVQKHFNDIELKIRQLAITVSGLLLGGIITASKLTPSGENSNLISIGFFLTAIIWLIFYFVDRCWYHPLLKGSVDAGLELEDKISSKLKITGLTKHIGKRSPINLKILAGKKLHSGHKMDIFYISIILALMIASVISFYS